MSNNTYSAIAIANAFIARAKADNEGISPMKIQKLVYFAHAWMLALFNQPLITDPVKAWKFGPVIDSLYHEFKNFGSRNISNYGTLFIESSDNSDWFYDIPLVNKDDTNVNALIDKIWQVYGSFSAMELSDLTHEPGSPWYITNDEHMQGAKENYVLANQLIGECMAKQLTTV